MPPVTSIGVPDLDDDEEVLSGPAPIIPPVPPRLTAVPVLPEQDEETPPPEKGPSITDYLKHMLGTGVRAVGKEFAALPKAIGIGAAELNRITGVEPGTVGTGDPTDPKQRGSYIVGQAIENATGAITPSENPALKDSFWATQVPSAVGSGIGFLLGGGVGRLGTSVLRRGITSAATRGAEAAALEAAAKKGAPLALKAAGLLSEGAEIATLGATSQFQSAYEDALQAGADRNHALAAGLWNLPIGATEIVPLGKMLDRLDKFAGGSFSKYLLSATKETFEEALQEAAQGLASNVVEQKLYNPAKELLSDLAPQAAAGGISGFLLSTLTHAIGGGVNATRGALKESRMRRQSDAESSERITQAIARKEEGPAPAAEPAPIGPQDPVQAAIDQAYKQPVLNAPPSPNVPIEIQQPDGTVVKGEFNGYYDLRDLGRGIVPSIGKVLPDGKMTHTLLDVAKGEKIIGAVPTFEEWQQSRIGSPVSDAIAFMTETTVEDQKLRDLVSSGSARVSDVLRHIATSQTGPMAEVAAELLKVSDPASLNVSVVKDSNERTSNYNQGTDRVTMAGRGNIPLSIYLHEAMHALTAKKVPFLVQSWPNQFRGKLYLQALGTIQSDAGVKNPSLVGLTQSYLKAVDHYSKTVSDITDVVGDQNATYSGKGAHYGLTNIHEFIAEAFSNREFQKWLDTIPTEAGRGETVWRRLVDAIRNLLGLKAVNSSFLQQVLEDGATLAATRRGDNGEAGGVNYEPGPAVNVDSAQVQAGAAEVGRIAEGIYGRREAGAVSLETTAYERKQYRTARNELKRLTGLATARITQEHGLEAENVEFPDPNDGVRVGDDGTIEADNTFVDALTRANVPHNPDNVRDLQEQMFLERKAKRYNDMVSRLADLQAAEVYYGELGVDPKEITKLNKKIVRLGDRIEKLGAATLDNETVAGRAGEMAGAEAMKVDNMGQRDALSLPPVAEFFGREVGGYSSLGEKLKTGLAFANELARNSGDPVELGRAMTEVEKWVNVPADVRSAIRGGMSLTPEQLSSIYAALGQVFEDFEASRQRMADHAAIRLPEIDQALREKLLKLANSKIQSGMGQVLLSDVLASLDGESGGTGTLQSEQVAKELRDLTSATESFGLHLGKHLETNQLLYDWLVNPEGPAPVAASEQLGVDPRTLQLILRWASRSPAFSSSIITIIDHASSRLAEMPSPVLAQIAKDVASGNLDQANAAAALLTAKAQGMTSMGAASMRRTLREIQDLNVERKSITEGQNMFAELANAPDFAATSDALNNSAYGLVEPMVPQNDVETTFKPFGRDGIPAHEGLVQNVDNDPFFKSEWFRKVNQWYVKAQEHLNAYDAAQAMHDADPVANPSPAILGFDLPKVRGLRDAVYRHVAGSFLDNSVNAENKRWKTPASVKWMSKWSMFKQHDAIAKMVGGILGTDLRGRLADFINHYQIAQRIRDTYRDLPEKVHAAMKSHPEVKMNLQEYRQLFNEIAHWGRMFGTPLRVGFVLPMSGRTVTAADMALLKRERAYEETLRREVTETNPTQGVRVKTINRTLVRPGAYVGDEGLPRHLNVRSKTFVADVVRAYGEPVTGFDPTTNLSSGSSSLVVQFWNRNIRLLKQHILDARRQDRTMNLSPTMQRAESDLADNWTFNGAPSIQSLDDLVNALVATHPGSAGISTRDAVIKGLNSELRQYRDAAKGIQNERAIQQQARSSAASIAFSADNEFTKPAAKLELPTEFYDYGAITPGDHLTISSRANHERIIGYATAVNRAIGDLLDRLIRYRNKEITEAQAAQSYGGSIEEMNQVIALLQRVGHDFEAAYAQGNPSRGPTGFFNGTLNLMTAAVLALPVVGLRNMTQGQFEVYAMARAMGVMGHRMALYQASKNALQTVGRFSLQLGEGIVKKTEAWGLVSPSTLHIYQAATDAIGKMLFDPNYRRSNEIVGELGLDNRDSFLRRMRRIWQEASEFTNLEELEGKWTFRGKRVDKLAAMPASFLRAAFDKIGVQNYDFAINAQALTHATMLEKRLKEVAITYGNARRTAGTFDPTSRVWDLHPDEWNASKLAKDNEDSLSFFRLFLESSANPEGFQLERGLWDYYQRSNGGANTTVPFFTERQRSAVQIKMLADFNASTPANRPSGIPGSPVLRNILLLQGYVSDGLLKVMSAAFGGVRDRGMLARALTKAPALFGLALASWLIGIITGALTGAWEKYVRGRTPSMATPLDADFYTNWKRFAEGSIRLSAAQWMLLGDITLQLMGEVQGNRGFDPTGRVFALSIATRALTAMRGSYNTLKGAGNIADATVPLTDIGRSMFPFWLEAENIFGKTAGAIKQAERVLRGEAQVQGLLEGRSGFQPPTYGPTTVVRRNLGDAISQWWNSKQTGDAAGTITAMEKAKAELKKLEDYHYAKYLAAGMDPETARAKAQRDVINDYQDINPAVAAMLGKRPTDDQYALMRAGTTGDRGKIVEAGIAAWQAGSMELFGREGAITREQLAAARGGGGGPGNPALRRMQPASGVRPYRAGSGAGGGGGTGVAAPTRRAASGSRRRRSGATAQGGVSRAGSPMRRAGSQTRYAVRKALSPRVGTSRQKSLGSRRRRSYLSR